MMKRILCLMLVLCCTLTLTGCVSTPENNAPAAPTLPPAEAKFAPPVGDIALNHTATAPLYLPSTDGQRLLTEYVPLSLNHSRHSAQVMVEALLQHPATQTTQALGNGVTLSLYGAQPVEVSSGVCTVNLAANALQLDQQSLYKVCAAITATLCEMDDIQYVNFLVADQAVSMDITGNLPLGGQTAHPGEELTVLWEQTDARRAPLGEDPATIPVTAVATLYFPLADGSGIAAETRNLTFPGQSADQLAAGLISALSAGAQYLSGTSSMPDMAALMSAPVQTTELDDGGRMVNVYFHAGLENTLRQAQVDMPCFISAVTCTLSSFIPSVSSVRMYIGATPLTSLYSAVHGNLIFQGGLMQRPQFAPYLMDQVTLYLSSGDKLKPVRRALPHRQSRDPRTLLAELMEGPTQQELDAGYEPVLPEGLDKSDILGISLQGDTLLLNLSSRCADLIRTQAASWEQIVCYSLVNTLGESMGAQRVRFFFDGEMLEELGGTLYWGGEFLVNPGMIDQPLG
ncbi:MAG: GerMN domain-containing protein [Clostridia bacterium]|nr:GerMN domain-containing protein [Clostridia bacterium]